MWNVQLIKYLSSCFSIWRVCDRSLIHPAFEIVQHSVTQHIVTTHAFRSWLLWLFNGFYFLKYSFVYLLLAELGLHCCVRAFSGYGELGLLSSCRVWAHCGVFSCCRAQVLERADFGSCDSRA